MTIRNKKAFDRKPAANFDGIFDWDWMKGCFSHPLAEPTDFDGVVERNGQFIVFETKDPGVKIKRGQFIALQKAHALNCFTIMFIHGKLKPEGGSIWWPGAEASEDNMGEKFTGLEEAREMVRKWWDTADAMEPF